MRIREGFVGAIGNTPLIRLARLSAETGCEILGKAEFMNPGGSVKDRAAMYIVRDAERRGALKPGGTVVEGTAGNTGIGLAHICAARGYRCVIVIPDNQSPEKMDLLRKLGAEVRPVPPKPYADPDNYQRIAGRLAASLPNAIWANQFDNVANRQAHFETTGREIWRDTGGRVDAFVCAVGTGGTLAGVARFLKQRSSRIRIVLADPHGSALFSWVKTGELKAEGTSITEGIGTTRVTANLRGNADRRCGLHRRCDLRQDGLPAVARGRLVRGRLLRHQRRRGCASRARSGAGPHDRHAAVRPRQPVLAATVQSRLVARKGTVRGLNPRRAVPARRPGGSSDRQPGPRSAHHCAASNLRSIFGL